MTPSDINRFTSPWALAAAAVGLLCRPAAAGIFDCYQLNVETRYSRTLDMHIHWRASGCAGVVDNPADLFVCKSADFSNGASSNYVYQWGTSAPSLSAFVAGLDINSCPDSYMNTPYYYCSSTGGYERGVGNCPGTPKCSDRDTLTLGDDDLYYISGGCYGMCEGCGAGGATIYGSRGLRRELADGDELSSNETDVALGDISMIFPPDHDPRIRFHLSGLEPGQSNLTFAVLSSNTCEEAELEVAAHHYNETHHAGTELSPWDKRKLTSNVNGEIYGAYAIDHGFEPEFLDGFAVVLTDSDDTILGCGVVDMDGSIPVVEIPEPSAMEGEGTPDTPGSAAALSKSMFLSAASLASVALLF